MPRVLPTDLQGLRWRVAPRGDRARPVLSTRTERKPMSDDERDFPMRMGRYGPQRLTSDELDEMDRQLKPENEYPRADYVEARIGRDVRVVYPNGGEVWGLLE